MARFVCHIGAKVPADDAVPGGVVPFVEFFLDVRGNVLFDVVLFQGLRRTVHRVLLHLFAHVGVLDHCLAIAHFAAATAGFAVGSTRRRSGR